MNGVLLLTPLTTSHIGGMEIYNEQLAAALGAALKGNVSLLPVDDPKPVRESQAPYRLISLARFHQLPSRILRDHLKFRWASWQAARAIQAHSLDFILCGYAHLLPWAAELSRQHGIPYGVIGHGIEMWGALAPVKLAALQQVDWAIAVSRFTAEKMEEKGVPRSRLFLLPPHVDTRHYRQDPAAGLTLRRRHGWEGKTILLTVGRLSSRERYKGHETVMQAVRAALPAHPRLLYVIAGGGDDLPRLRALAAQWGITSQVQFLGPIPEAEKVALYNACDAFIMMSQMREQDNRWTGEGFGIVFLEASACGKAVIAPNVGGARDAVEDGVSGLAINPEDVSAIREAILQLAKDPARRGRMGEEGRARAVRQFDLAVLSKQVEELLYAISQRTVPV